MTRLTFDIDWGVFPTAQRLVLGSEDAAPYRTLEAEVYEYANEGRPHDPRHHILWSPSEIAARLKARGLPNNLEIVITDRHHQILEIPEFQNEDHLIYFDAHLDIYGVMEVDLDMRYPGKNLHTVTVRDYDRLDERLNLDRRIHANFIHQIQNSLREGGWLLWVPPLMIKGLIDWIVPTHFWEAIRKQGFKYPRAQWRATLPLGFKHHLWMYDIQADAHRIVVYSGLDVNGPKLQINIRPLDDLPSLENVQSPLHICRSPHFVPPKMDGWAEQLRQALEPKIRGRKRTLRNSLPCITEPDERMRLISTFQDDA